MTAHPYADLPPRAFWKTAISDRHVQDLSELWTPMPISQTDRIATAGSCFAQHIGRRLIQQNYNFMNVEPPPPGFSAQQAHHHGFGVYSCRYGNIYTTRQLYQLALEACERRTPEDGVWTKGERYFDALRPSVDPVGHDSADTIAGLRRAHLSKIREMLQTLDVFVFTLGLTETWEAISDGTVYPTAPGTTTGQFDERKYRFRNFRYNEVRDDLVGFWQILREINPRARMLLTVSPVPLTATASGQHVLVATMQSKSTLRAVAGDLAADIEDIAYFPSYEIIAGHPARAMFFDPNLRAVNAAGVQYVMTHFFRNAENPATVSVPSTPKTTAAPKERVPALPAITASNFPDGIICDEETLEQFAR